MSSKKETISNIYNIIFKRNKKVLIKFFLVSTPGCLAAFFEGITFALLLSSLYILNGRGIEVFQGKPILKHLATIPFLQELSANALFIIMVLAAIAAQIIKSLIFYYSSMKAAKLNAKISCELHENIYEHILSFDFATVSNYKAGGLASYTQIPSTSLIPILDSLHKSVVNSIVLLVLLAVLFKISLPL
ncbi:MAG: hypothetical protein HRU43_04330, partial [Simkaniaceae bacterium]|nr:hypothetical protein [Simkaniaceae bacterium]